MEGIGQICQRCMKEITVKDDEEKNGPITISNLPGYYHKKCKAYFDMEIVGRGNVVEDLSKSDIYKKIKE